MASVTAPGKKIFKRWASVLVFCAVSTAFAIVAVGSGGGFATNPDSGMERIFIGLSIPLISAGIIWLCFSVGVFPGVVVRFDKIIVNNFLYEIYIPLGSVSGVSWRGGMRVRVEDGKSYPCHAFPNSLYSFVLGYRHFKRVAEKIEWTLDEVSSDAPKGPVIERSNAHLKFFLLTLCFLSAGFLIFFAIVRI